MHIVNTLIAGMLLLVSSCALPADDDLAMAEGSATEQANLFGLVGTANAASPDIEHRGDHDGSDQWVCVARHRSCRGDDRHGFTDTSGADLATVSGDDLGPVNREHDDFDDDHDDDDRDHDDDRCYRDCRSRFYVGVGDRRQEARREARARCEDGQRHDSRRCDIVTCKRIY